MLRMKPIIIIYCCCCYTCYDYESSYQCRKSYLSVSLGWLASGRVDIFFCCSSSSNGKFHFWTWWSSCCMDSQRFSYLRTVGGFPWHSPNSRHPVIWVEPRRPVWCPRSLTLNECCLWWEVHTLPWQTISLLGSGIVTSVLYPVLAWLSCTSKRGPL